MAADKRKVTVCPDGTIHVEEDPGSGSRAEKSKAPAPASGSAPVAPEPAAPSAPARMPAYTWAIVAAAAAVLVLAVVIAVRFAGGGQGSQGADSSAASADAAQAPASSSASAAGERAFPELTAEEAEERAIAEVRDHIDALVDADASQLSGAFDAVEERFEENAGAELADVGIGVEQYMRACLAVYGAISYDHTVYYPDLGEGSAYVVAPSFSTATIAASFGGILDYYSPTDDPADASATVASVTLEDFLSEAASDAGPSETERTYEIAFVIDDNGNAVLDESSWDQFLIDMFEA